MHQLVSADARKQHAHTSLASLEKLALCWNSHFILLQPERRTSEEEHAKFDYELNLSVTI